MTTTPNLGLKKPGSSDPIDISALNDNADALDTFAGETNTALAGKQDSISDLASIRSGAAAGATAVQQTAFETDQSRQDALEAEDRAALIAQVDGGAKNLLKNALAGKSSVKYAVTATFDANGVGTISGTNDSTTNDSVFSILDPLTLPVGHYHASGCPSGGAVGTYRIDFISSSGGVYRDIGNGVDFEIAENETIRAQFVVYHGKAAPTGTVQPMICTAADYAISPAFVPYAMSNVELTENVLNKQDIFLYTDRSNATTYSFNGLTNIPDSRRFKYGILIGGGAANHPENAMMWYVFVDTSENVFFTKIIGNGAQTLTGSISDGVLTITSSTTIYGGLRLMWLG